MRYLNTFLVMLSVSGDLYSSEVILEMKQSNSYVLTCNNNTTVLDSIETFAEEFNKINSEYMHVNSVKKFDDTLVLDGLSSKKICNFILNGSIDYKPNVTLHITGNNDFESIVGDNTGHFTIDSDTDAYVTDMVANNFRHKNRGCINGKFELKVGSTFKINHPYFKLKFVSKNN